jgi:hypothetical protein
MTEFTNNDFPPVAFVANTNLHDQISQAVQDTPPVTDSGQVDSVEAAAILGVTANNLRQMVHKRQIVPAGKRGRRTIFNRADVEGLAERRRK